MKIVMCAVTLAAGSAWGDVLFSQPTTSDDASVGLGWFSHNAARATRSFKHADDFELAVTADVERVVWWGLSENLVHPDLTNFTSFTVEFYTARFPPSGVGRPDELIAGETFDLAETNAAATGRVSPGGAIEYRHEVELTTPAGLDAGQVYYVAISAGSIDGSGDGWQWQDADLFDGFSASYDYDRDKWTPFLDTDSAVELHGTPVPSPATVCLLIAGVLGRARRRR